MVVLAEIAVALFGCPRTELYQVILQIPATHSEAFPVGRVCTELHSQFHLFAVSVSGMQVKNVVYCIP